MKNTFPIYICTKGRAGNSAIIQECDDKELDCTLFVEPQEIEVYRQSYGRLKIVDIGANDKGLAYARNYVRKYAISADVPWYWNIDDDVKFYEIIKNKAVPTGMERLGIVEKYFKGKRGIGQIGLQYSQFAWSATKQFGYTSYCDCFVCNKTDVFKSVKFDNKSTLKLDRDATLQVLTQGYNTMIINKFAFSSPKNGSNKGGLYEKYQEEGFESESSKYMVKKWGEDICKLNTKKDGRPDVRINWRVFKQQHQNGHRKPK